jgi:hypothetical protein
MPTPVRYPGGVTNAAPFQTLAQAGFLDPSYYQVYFNDFHNISTSDFVATDIGLPTTAITAGAGGILTNTTTTGATDAAFLQLPAANFALTTATSTVGARKAFFKTRIALSDATNSSFYAGLLNTTTTPLAATDGIYFYKATGATTLSLVNIATSTTTTLTLPTAVSALANATYVELGFYYDGKGNIQAFVNPSTGYYPQSGSAATNVASANKGAVGVLTPAAISSANLNLSFGIQNGAAAAKTLSVDYILAAVER